MGTDGRHLELDHTVVAPGRGRGEAVTLGLTGPVGVHLLRRQAACGGAIVHATRENTAVEMTELSIVIPVYGCEPCLRALHERLRQATAEIPGEAEIVFVDDRSHD